MARPLDLRQQRELTEFVNALYKAAGYTTLAEWARDSDYPASNLSDIRNEKSGVDGYNLLRLIRAAAARSHATPEELATRLATELARGSAESVDSRLGELSALVQEALTLLKARLPQPEAVPRKRGGQRTDRKRSA